jgi:hypothetical protein
MKVYEVVFADGPIVQVLVQNNEGRDKIMRRARDQLKSSPNFETRRASMGRILNVRPILNRHLY